MPVDDPQLTFAISVQDPRAAENLIRAGLLELKLSLKDAMLGQLLRDREFSLQKSALRLGVPTPINGTVPPRRQPNSETRDREHLTEAEIERLMKAAGENRTGTGTPP
jgi:hypothetical protein